MSGPPGGYMDMMTIEDLQERVAAIQKTIEAIKTSGVSEKALFLLVQHSAPSVKGKKIPVGVITAILGGPFFLWLLIARTSRGKIL